jgi:hypothetical protein
MQITETNPGVVRGLNSRFQQNLPAAALSNMSRSRAFLDQTPESRDKIA